MKIDPYLEATAQSRQSFAALAKISQSSFNRYANGQVEPRSSDAARIIRESKKNPAPGGGIITLTDMVADR